MKVYTMNEAAKTLRISRRYFQDWLRDHPFDADGRPFYASIGRRKTFDEDDLRRIREAAREEDRRRLTPPGRRRMVDRRTSNEQRSSEEELNRLLELARPRRR